jgi:hypothetical protein
VARTLLAIGLAALVLGGCGPDADRSTARAVTDRFFAALGSGNGDEACAQLSPDTRSELESQERKPCRDAITGVGLEGAPIAGVHVYLFNAIAELANGDAAFLEEGQEGWRLSAVGCKSQGKPTSRPYDCDVED